MAARRWLGLTATPKRADHRQEIMFMHCGPVRHRVTAGSDMAKTLLIHPTGFTTRDDIDGDVLGLLSSIILLALVADEQRTRQVCADVAEAARRGRNCLVLTGRTGPVSALVTGLQAGAFRRWPCMAHSSRGSAWQCWDRSARPPPAACPHLPGRPHPLLRRGVTGPP